MATRFTLNQATASKVFDLKEVPLNATGNTITFSIANTSTFDTSKLKIRIYDDADSTNYLNNYYPKWQNFSNCTRHTRAYTLLKIDRRC